MPSIFDRLTKKDETPSAIEMREMILRLERDEALEAEAAETSLWAQQSERPRDRYQFLSANTPKIKQKPQTSENDSAFAS